MNKKLWIIANDDGLPGVKKDILNIKDFFKSPFGGNWYESEIDEYVNYDKELIINRKRVLKAKHLDYLVIYFSGHGGWQRETNLTVNPKSEKIGESELLYISEKQLNIFDCCRCYSETKMSMDSLVYKIAERFGNTREKYEERIAQANDQQVTLYACKIGEFAHDQEIGAVYTTNLLKAARELNGEEYKLVSLAHDEASNLMDDFNRGKPTKDQQHPDHSYIKFNPNEQLIISVNPYR
jgi:hypothetical protein